ncbi:MULTISPECIES: hypothetical protein [Pseudomonas]|uniref:hypothetical protein n=1 Tax=Pseudomonas TaxID=286 RepID=UPI000D00A9D0|nr:MULTISPECIES: hypothetical protein [Pseudomonas]PRA53203.1 hypothetical protein CQZ98_14320 [Pseudomonas sp. MYb115]QXN52193.1 hypothetical protein KW062_10835 [Pseudomonas fluorescens]WSO26522.1 hypothetical protein VUJ50_10895 [Pseudomonas fluorescens]
MNAALKICQFNYDAQLPSAVSEQDYQREWLESAAEQLVCGSDVTWKRRLGPVQRVTAAEYATHLQLHLTQRQIDGLDDRDSFAKLVLSSVVGSSSDCRTHAKYLLGSERLIERLEEIAADLLRPHAADAATAQREEAEDDVDGDL